ncbi:hypothetical protein DBV14_03625 [Variovorax sp. KBW07]|nr:hypothetical protein DBV14_03625 [Variovorax sp. KBW07]
MTSYTYDLLGNVLTATNALGHVTNYTHDTAKRVVSTMAPNGLVTGYTYDAAHRLTDAANATATLKYNALNAVTEAKDFKGVVTAYGRDAQGNATAEACADVGSASTQHDSLGLPS